jgi:CubicO group peptidase (beta-lactamase class C family)
LKHHITQFATERVTDGEWNFYYNTGFTILGELIATCSEYSYAEYVRQRILGPLGMSRSCFQQEEFEARSDRITPYRLEDGNLVQDTLAFDELLYAAGGLCSPPSEMATYVQMLMNDGAGAETQVLSKSSMEMMTTGRTEWSETLDGTVRKYGYGVFAQPFLDDTLISHGGMMETTTAWFGYLSDADRGVFLASNTTPSRPLKTLGQTLLAITQDQDPDSVVPRRMLDRKLDPLTGTYETTRGAMTATVRRLNGALRIEADNPGWTQTCVAIPESLSPDSHSFRVVSDDGVVDPVEFEVDDDDVTLRIGRWQLHRQSTTD